MVPLKKEKNVWHVYLYLLNSEHVPIKRKLSFVEDGTNTPLPVLPCLIIRSSFHKLAFGSMYFTSYSWATTHIVTSRTHFYHDGPAHSLHNATWFGTVGCRNVLASSSYTKQTGKNNLNLTEVMGKINKKRKHKYSPQNSN